jgi:aminopeptidase N
MRLLVDLARGGDPDDPGIGGLAEALQIFLREGARHDPAFAALVLSLPGEAEIAQEIAREVDPDAVHRARLALRERIGRHCLEELIRVRDDLSIEGEYSPDAASAGRRALRNGALDLIAAGDPLRGERQSVVQVEQATNMTDRLAALGTLSTLPGEAREKALAAFGDQYRDEPLVLDKWFGMQASIAEDGTLDRVRRLMLHPAFSLGNPNRVRALIGAFAMLNQTGFHRADGSGYGFLADIVLQLDRANPQLAARLLTSFGPWRTMEAVRRAHAEDALRRIAAMPDLSRDVGDIVQRSLAG